MAVDQLLRPRSAALQRAEARLATGSYGRSVRSGQPIPDERLEADPLAEPTVQTSRSRAEHGRGGQRPGRVGVGQPSLPVLAEPDITPEEEQAAEEDDEPAPEPDPGIHIEPHNQAR